MRILYGVQGTGNGHITRARRLGPALTERGAEVDYLFSGRESEHYFGMEHFGEYECREGFTLKTRAGRLQHWDTLKSASPLQFMRDVKKLDTRKYDLVLSDFEPITAWAARLQGTPSIGVAHQFAFNHAIPGRECFGMLASLLKWFAPVDQAIGLHWSSFGAPILPPMIQPASEEEAQAARMVLVYLPFDSLDRLVDFLEPIQSHYFRVYADVPAPIERGSVRVLPLSRESFAKDLSRCAGVFANAGFGVCSEAIQAGKKLLVKPLKGQIEQEANAVALTRLELGEVMQCFDLQLFESWLARLNQRSSMHLWPDTAEILADWILNPERSDLRHLSDYAWSRAPRPQRNLRSTLVDRVSINADLQLR